MEICLAIHEILANKAFTIIDGLISWLFVVAFVYLIYMQITLMAFQCNLVCKNQSTGCKDIS